MLGFSPNVTSVVEPGVFYNNPECDICGGTGVFYNNPECSPLNAPVSKYKYHHVWKNASIKWLLLSWSGVVSLIINRCPVLIVRGSKCRQLTGLTKYLLLPVGHKVRRACVLISHTFHTYKFVRSPAEFKALFNINKSEQIIHCSIYYLACFAIYRQVDITNTRK